jgi:hypothetical protein
MEKPILLTKKKLIKPIELALERIEAIEQRKAGNIDIIILEGLFTLAVASFEHSLNDTLKELLTKIPEKLDFKSEPVSKEELLYGYPLKQTIENKIIAIGYKSLPEILKYFIKITGIDTHVISEDELDKLLEIKATRNLLIHNNLIVNNIYNETAGPNKRRSHSSNRLLIDQDYLFQSLVTIKQVLENIKDELSVKYASFTKIKATKSLFQYIFKPTSVLTFEDEFYLNEQRDEVGGIKQDSTRIEWLSTSERFFYNLWLAHSHEQDFEFKNGSIFRLDSHNKKKLEYFLSALDILKF